MKTVPVSCPQCQTRHEVKKSRLGKKKRCTKCQTIFLLAPSLPGGGETFPAGTLPPEGGAVPFSEADTAEWAPGQLLLDDFVVERELGEGGMGKVFLVRSQGTGRHFAVKRAKVPAGASHFNFLAELRTWIDLPEHPHLVPCRFFRTVGDRIVVFADYVEGGSLEERIRDRKLTQIDLVLDVAIQLAWGVEAAHSLGLVHQDIKPGNIMITSDGVARVTDFGLARARARTGEAAAVTRHSILVSTGGMTPAYCSPEQADGQGLSRKTNVWSWGLSVLEMFTGGVTWKNGREALEVLEDYLEQGAEVPPLPALPPPLADILRKCFQPNPAERWETMAELADALAALYRETTGVDYPRAMPPPPVPVKAIAHDRKTHTSAYWDNPRDWLFMALKEAGRNPTEARTSLSPHGGSRQAQEVGDLAVFGEAHRILEGLIESGRTDLEGPLAHMLVDKALVHDMRSDMPGCLAMLDRAIDLYQRAFFRDASPTWKNELAMAFMIKGNMKKNLHDYPAAVALHDLALAIQEQLVLQEGQREFQNDLARTYTNKAIAARSLGDRTLAVALCDQAIALREPLVFKEKQSWLRADLAETYLTKGAALSGMGDKRAAVNLYDRAIAIYQRMVLQEKRRDKENNLAEVYHFKAGEVAALGDKHSAIQLFDRVIAIRERLVFQEDRRELEGVLAASYWDKGRIVRGLGDNRVACELYDQAIAIYERLVLREGRRELENRLAWAYRNKGYAVTDIGDHRVASDLYGRFIAIYERLVLHEGRRELEEALASAYIHKGFAFWRLKDNRTASDHYGRAIAIYERLVLGEGRQELENLLADVYLKNAFAVRALGDNRAASDMNGRAVAIYERLVLQEGRRDLTCSLGQTYCFKATTHTSQGEYHEAVKVFDQVLSILDHLVNKEGRREHFGDWAEVLALRAEAFFMLGDRQRSIEDANTALPILQAELAQKADPDWQKALEKATAILQPREGSSNS